MVLLFEYSSAPLRTIEEIQFGLLSPEEIKGMSVCHVEYPETMDEARLRPREKGLNDPHLGSIDRSFKCATCDEGMTVCPGHFGHIELATPVFHVGFINKIKKVLETICYNCGKIKLDENNDAFRKACSIRDPKTRFNAVMAALQKVTVFKGVAKPSDEPDDVVEAAEDGGPKGGKWDSHVEKSVEWVDGGAQAVESLVLSDDDIEDF